MSAPSGEIASPRFACIGPCLFDGGYCSFYLMASGYAALALFLWMGNRLQWMTFSHIDLLWLAHETVFGVIAAVFIGFLYSAARDWTTLDPARGIWLALIAGVWLAGRGAMLLAPTPVLAAADCAFLFLAPLPFYRVLKLSRMRRHIVLVELLCLLALLNFLYHAANLGMSRLSPGKLVDAAAIVSVILATLSLQCRTREQGRADALVATRYRDKFLAWLLVLTAAVTAAGLLAPATAVLPFAVAANLVARQPWKAAQMHRGAIRWTLFVSRVWVPLAFILLGLASLGLAEENAAPQLIAPVLGAGLVLEILMGIVFFETGRPVKREMQG